MFSSANPRYGDNVESSPERVVFMFPGPGRSARRNGARALRHRAGLRRALRHLRRGIPQRDGHRPARHPVGDASGDETDLERTDRSQPALFAVEYALGKLIESYGVRAGAYVGYSTGEYIAATLAGVFDLTTAIKTVSLRARLMHESPPGAMVAVALGPDDIAEYLSTAGSSCPRSTIPATAWSPVAEGPDQRIQPTSSTSTGYPARRVRATHAFHSSSMDPDAGRISGLPVPSGASRCRTHRCCPTSPEPGCPMSRPPIPATWARQISSTVRFADELDVGTEPIRTGSSSKWAPAAA